jgi:hypothetical protein
LNEKSTIFAWTYQNCKHWKQGWLFSWAISMGWFASWNPKFSPAAVTIFLRILALAPGLRLINNGGEPC